MVAALVDAFDRRMLEQAPAHRLEGRSLAQQEVERMEMAAQGIENAPT
jgi:hypothetical protein